MAIWGTYPYIGMVSWMVISHLTCPHCVSLYHIPRVNILIWYAYTVLYIVYSIYIYIIPHFQVHIHGFHHVPSIFGVCVCVGASVSACFSAKFGALQVPLHCWRRSRPCVPCSKDRERKHPPKKMWIYPGQTHIHGETPANDPPFSGGFSMSFMFG